MTDDDLRRRLDDLEQEAMSYEQDTSGYDWYISPELKATAITIGFLLGLWLWRGL